jgi:hydroxypyruvate reductase
MTRPIVLANATLSSWLMEGLAELATVRPVEEALADGGVDDSTVLVTTAMVGAEAALVERLPALRLIAVHGVGYDRIDVGHANARGIIVTHTPDVLTDDVADMAIALVLATMRRITANDRFVRESRWPGQPLAPLSRRVTGARFGILGLGRIGQAIARRIEPFSDNISYHSRRPVPGCAYAYVESAAALAAVSDVLIVAAAGGAGTERLIDARVLDALGPEGMLVNIGRGSTVDEAALIAALEEGRIAGAGLDVFADEPHVPDRLCALDQVVLQPHHASATIETRRAMAALVVDNVRAAITGNALVTPVPLQELQSA